MSPSITLEVYVLDDGGEVDLDLGSYERFLDVTLTRRHKITTGKMYLKGLETEREGGYLGKTMVPHVTNAVQEWIESVAHLPVDGSSQAPQVCVIELGGTKGCRASARRCGSSRTRWTRRHTRCSRCAASWKTTSASR